MLTIKTVQSFFFKMSVKNLGFPLPKIEEDGKIIIDLDTEGNSPEDIVIEWHLEIRRFLGSYSAASGEISLVNIMKKYIVSITERAIHFEDIVRLLDLVDNHMEHIYWFYRDSEICFSDIYLDHMEHILTFYVNLTLRVLLLLKKKVKVTLKKVNDMSQKVIKRLSFYLLQSEYHIFHVMIRQTTTLVDGMIKDVMNILNSNICKHLFRNLYLHFLVLTPVRDMSDEAFCRAYILFENWKAFEDYKQNERIEECIKGIFKQDMISIKENEFLRKILMPQTSIMSELMKVMCCQPSITKAYFDYIKSKHKGDTEILDDIGKLALEDALLLETELTDDDDYETTYTEIFDKIMGDAKYNLNDIVLNTGNCKNEEVSLVPGQAAMIGEVEILISDTDSDSDVEIVSIVPSQNITRQVPNTTKGNRNPVANTQTTSFLDSISIDVDTIRRKNRFRTLANFDNLPPNKIIETNKITTAVDNTSNSSIAEDQGSSLDIILDKPTESAVDNDKDLSITENGTSKTVESSGSEHNVSTTDTDTPTLSEPNSLITNVFSNHSHEAMELEVLEGSHFNSEKNTDPDPSKVVAVSSTSNGTEEDSTSNGMEEDSTSQAVESLPITQAPSVTKNSQNFNGIQTNGIGNHICRCSQLTSPVLTEEEHVKSSDVFPTISSTTENLEVIGEDEEIRENGAEVNHRQNVEEASSTADITHSESISENVKVVAQKNASPEVIAEDCVDTEINIKQKVHKPSNTGDYEKCQTRDRTLKCANKPEVLKCRTETHVDEPTCDSGCGKDETTILHSENIPNAYYINSITNKSGPSEETTPLDTGQDHFVQPLDTGQFDANSPASPDNVEVNLNSPYDKSEEKLLRTVSEPVLREAQNGEFGYPTPPGSEEERDKDSDEQTKLIYLPTQTFIVDETIEPQDSENKTLTSKVIQKQDFFSGAVIANDMTTTDTERIERLPDKQRGDASTSLGKSYEQIVKDAIGSQDFTEDKEDEIQIISSKYNKDKDQDIDFADMEEFLKNCDKEGYIQANRKKRKRTREKTTLEDIRSRKNSSANSSPKRVKINEKPETYFITTSYDEDSKDDIDDSSSDNEMHSSRHGVKDKRGPSPMPSSNYLSKRNGAVTHIPLSGRLSPDKPPPLKGILKQIEQKHTYHSLHPVDDEPETVIIVLHQREVGRGMRGSVEVKVYRKSFTAYKIRFDDRKLCHHAYVKLQDLSPKKVDKRNKVPDRARIFEEEMFNQPEKPMYKIVFDKKTAQLNSNDRKYYCDPSISSNSSTLLENKQGTVNLSTEIAFIKTPEPVESINEPAIQTPISPPCFSPSSNSSSEFSDPTNLIPYQDIERALQVVEPDKPGEGAPDYSLECHDSNDSLDKSLVDRIALETIELLSNNADFHKMLRDLNGDVLIENVPLIGVNGTGNIGNVTGLPNTPSNNDDLVSNLNSDEQLLKKVCQELESEALVDTLTTDPTSAVIVTESFLELNVGDNLSCEPTVIVEMGEQEIEIDNTNTQSDQICYQGETNVHLSSFPQVPNNSFSLHGSMSSVANSSIPVAYSETNYSTVNTPITAKYSPPVTNSIHQETFSSTSDLNFRHSGQPQSRAPESNSPALTSKPNPVSISPVLTFHQGTYSALTHISTNQSTNSEMNLSSNSATLSKNSPVPKLQQQTYSTISELPSTHSGYAEPGFSDSSSLIRISAPLVSPVPNSLLQETYSSIPDSSLIHSTYSEIGVSLANSLPVYSVSNTNSPIAVPVYPEDPLRSTTSRLLSYPSSHSTVSAASLFTTDVKTNSYVHNVSPALPAYTETNCLNPNVPSFSKTNEPISINTYFEPSAALPNIAQNLVYAPNSEMLPLRSSSRFPPLQNSNISSFPPTNIPQTKTDKRRKRLPKEVLTISQLNDFKSLNIDCIDNNLEQSIYSPKSKKCAHTKSEIADQVGNPHLQNMHLTDQLCKNSRSKDPRLGQPLICVPPPFIQAWSKSSLVVNLPVSPETLKELAYKKSLNKQISHKLPITRKFAKKSINKASITNSARSCQVLRKIETAAFLGAPKMVANSTSLTDATKHVANGGSSPEAFNNNVSNGARFSEKLNVADSLNTRKSVQDASLFTGVSTNLSNPVFPFNSQIKVADATYKGTPQNDPDSVSFLGTPSNIVYSTTILVASKNITDDVGTSSVVPQNITDMPPFLDKPRKIADSTVTLNIAKKDLGAANFLQAPKNVPNEASLTPVEEVLAVPKVQASLITPLNESIHTQNILGDQNNKQTKSKTTGRKRGRPPKNSKSSSTKNKNKKVHHDIPSISKNIPPNSIHVLTNNCMERVPPLYHSEVPQRRYPATRNSTQPRIEPLKIIKDPKSKNGYTKVVKVNSSVHTKTTPLPMPVPETYNFETDTLKKEVYNIKPLENGENEVEFETHLPLKKRKLSIPVPSLAQAQPTTLANVPRSRDKKEEISYPATPMLSIADVYMQPRTFKTPAEKKQLPPESSNTVPIRYEPPPVPDSQFNCSLNTYAPAMFGFSKCPYSVEIDCNSYCPPPVLFPPKPFSHSN